MAPKRISVKVARPKHTIKAPKGFVPARIRLQKQQQEITND